MWLRHSKRCKHQIENSFNKYERDKQNERDGISLGWKQKMDLKKVVVKSCNTAQIIIIQNTTDHGVAVLRL